MLRKIYDLTDAEIKTLRGRITIMIGGKFVVGYLLKKLGGGDIVFNPVVFAPFSSYTLVIPRDAMIHLGE